GSIQLNAKYRLLRVEDQFIGVAIVALVDLPGSEEARLGYTADPGTTFTPMLAVEKRLGATQRFRVGANAGASLMSGSGSQITDLAGATDPSRQLRHGNLARLSVAASYRITESVDIVAEHYLTKLLANDAGGTTGTSGEAVGGFKIFV